MGWCRSDWDILQDRVGWDEMGRGRAQDWGTGMGGTDGGMEKDKMGGMLRDEDGVGWVRRGRTEQKKMAWDGTGNGGTERSGIRWDGTARDGMSGIRQDGMRRGGMKWKGTRLRGTDWVRRDRTR